MGMRVMGTCPYSFTPACVVRACPHPHSPPYVRMVDSTGFDAVVPLFCHPLCPFAAHPTLTKRAQSMNVLPNACTEFLHARIQFLACVPQLAAIPSFSHALPEACMLDIRHSLPNASPLLPLHPVPSPSLLPSPPPSFQLCRGTQHHRPNVPRRAGRAAVCVWRRQRRPWPAADTRCCAGSGGGGPACRPAAASDEGTRQRALPLAQPGWHHAWQGAASPLHAGRQQRGSGVG